MSDKLKGVWVDGALWQSKDFKAIEKHLLQKIKDLDNDKGCTAMNGWFADFLGISKSRVSQIISKFKNEKLISVKLKYNGKEVVGRVIKILKGGMLYFKQGVEKNVTPLSNPKDPSLILSEESNIVLSNRVSNLVECVKEKDTQLKNKDSEIENLKAKIESLKNQLEAEKEKSSAKKEKGSHEFPDNTPKKVYHTCDKRKNKSLSFDVVSANDTMKALYGDNGERWEELAEEVSDIYGKNPSKEIIDKCMRSFVTDGIGTYYTSIRSIDKFKERLYTWVWREIGFDKNKKQFNSNGQGKQSTDNGKSIYENFADMLAGNEHEEPDDTIDISWTEAEY
jgi:hypothetical protein